MNTTLVSLRMPFEIKERIEEFAKEDQRTFTSMVNKILYDYIKDHDKSETK